MMAAAKGHDDSVRVLLMRKADADILTWNDKTATMLAREGHHKETAQLIESLDRTLNPEVASMVAAGGTAPSGFLDNMIDAAASGAAQNLIQQAASGKIPDLNGVAQGALKGTLDPGAAQGAHGLLNAAAQGAAGAAVHSAMAGSREVWRASAIGAAQGTAASLLADSIEAADPAPAPENTPRIQAPGAISGRAPAPARRLLAANKPSSTAEDDLSSIRNAQASAMRKKKQDQSLAQQEAVLENLILQAAGGLIERGVELDVVAFELGDGERVVKRFHEGKLIVLETRLPQLGYYNRHIYMQPTGGRGVRISWTCEIESCRVLRRGKEMREELLLEIPDLAVAGAPLKKAVLRAIRFSVEPD
jgi:hypothetical protein